MKHWIKASASLLVVLLLVSTGSAQTVRYVSSFLWTGAKDVVVRDGIAYCAFASGLVTMDVSDASQPVVLGRVHTQGNGWAVALYGDHAFLADGVAGLRIFDVSEPAEPQLVATYDTPHNARDLEIRDGYVYLADGFPGDLEVIDVRDPTAPVWVTSYPVPDTASRVCMEGDRIYLLADYTYVHVLDISQPDLPTFLGSRSVSCAHDLAVRDDRLYTVSYEGGSRSDSWMTIYDVSEPADILGLGSCSVPDGSGQLGFLGSYAVVAVGWEPGGLRAVDVSDPEAPFDAGGLELPGEALGIFLVGPQAYVANGSGGLQVLDLTVPISPILLGSYVESCSPGQPLIRGDRLFLTDSGYGLRIADISDPEHPEVVAELELPNYAQDVAVSGRYAYVAAYISGLRIIELQGTSKPPGQPVEVNSWGSMANGVVIRDDRAYVTTGDDGLTILDISDPIHPTLVGSCPIPGRTDRIELVGDMAYVAASSAGLQIVDLSDPAHPVRRGAYDPMNTINDVVVRGQYAYATNGIDGLRILDISNPEDPQLKKTVLADSWLRGVHRVGRYLYVTDSYPGSLLVYDISSPLEPRLIDRYETTDGARGVCTDGSLVYLTDRGSLTILEQLDLEEHPPGPGRLLIDRK